MTAAERAKELQKKKIAEENEQKRIDEANQRYRETEKTRLRNLLLAALQSFHLPINERWFGGCDYWVLRNKEDTEDLCSCVLSFETGYSKPADECEERAYAYWVVRVYRRGWTGPAGRGERYVGGGVNKEDIDEAIAKVMQDHV